MTQFKRISVDKPAAPPREASPGTIFHVWHRQEPSFHDNDAAVLAHFPHAADVKQRCYFEHVASVECADVEEVYQLTNHIDHPWQQNREVIWSEVARSTSVGDVIATDAMKDLWTIDCLGMRKFR